MKNKKRPLGERGEEKSLIEANRKKTQAHNNKGEETKRRYEVGPYIEVPIHPLRGRRRKNEGREKDANKTESATL